MKVILLQKITGVGDTDQVKEVADGYARNFLFPRNLAVPASPQALKDLQLQKTKKAKLETQDLQKQQSLAQKLDGLLLEFKEKTSEKGQLYAAVTITTIINELTKRGLDVAKNQITLEPIKEPGDYTAQVKLRHGLEAELNISVLPR